MDNNIGGRRNKQRNRRYNTSTSPPAPKVGDYIEIGSKHGTRRTKGKPLAKNTIDSIRKLQKHQWKSLLDLPIASISKEIIVQWYNNLRKLMYRTGLIRAKGVCRD